MANALSAFERFKERVVGKVDAMRGRCWLLHQWGQWKVTRETAILRKFNDGTQGQIGHSVVQSRVCARCDKAELEVQKVYTV